MTMTDERADAISRNHDHDGGHSLVYGRMVQVAEQAQRKAARKAAKHRKRQRYTGSRRVSSAERRGQLTRAQVRGALRRQVRQVARKRAARRLAMAPVRLGAWGARKAVGFALRPVRIALTIVVWLIILLLLLPVIFPGLRDAPVLGGIIPGAMPASSDCGVPMRPVGGIRGASAAVGQVVHAMDEAPSPVAIHEGILAAAREVGAAWETFRASAVEGAPPPMEPMPQHGVPGYDNRLQVTAPVADHGTGSVDEVAQAIVAAGQSGETAATFVAIAGAESEYVREAANPTSNARGYWQTMTTVHNITEAQAFDPLFSARLAVRLKAESPRGFAGPWAETYGKGLHEPYMADARAAVARAEAAAASPTATPAAVAVGGAACLPGQAGEGIVRQASVDMTGLTNGALPASMLVPLSWTPGNLRADAAQSLESLNVAYRAAFGGNLVVSDTYRDMAGQLACEATKGSKRTGGGLCAVPGTSQHGWGVAVDLGGGVQRFGTPQHAWMVRNAPTFGWVHPAWAQASGSKPEPWHWEYAQAVNAG